MSVYDWILFFIIVALAITSGVSIFWTWEWKRRHDETVEMWERESEFKTNKIVELQKQLEEAKSWERVVKIERVALQPRELECKFMLHERFVDDTELFKKVITSEVARYMAEELNKDPHLCKIYHDVTNILSNNDAQEQIKVRFRLLPYAEGVVWDDIFKEEE